MVLTEGKKTASVARILRLNLSTAKMIILRQKRKLKIADPTEEELPVELNHENKTLTETDIKENKEEARPIFVSMDWWAYYYANGYPFLFFS